MPYLTLLRQLGRGIRTAGGAEPKSMDNRRCLEDGFARTIIGYSCSLLTGKRLACAGRPETFKQLADLLRPFAELAMARRNFASSAHFVDLGFSTGQDEYEPAAKPGCRPQVSLPFLTLPLAET